MGIMDLLSQAKPAPAIPMAANDVAVDPVAVAVQAFKAGNPTPDQKKIVAKLPASELSQTQSPEPSNPSKGKGLNINEAPLPAKTSRPPYWESTTEAKPVPFASLPLEQRPNNVPAGTEMLIPKTPGDVTKTPPIISGQPVTAGASGGAMPISAVPIAPMPIKPVADGGPAPVTTPGPISSGLVKAATFNGPDAAKATAKAMDTQVTPEAAKKATDAVTSFLAQNPDGGTLANILDIVGVALSAYGGTQRETMLQQRQKAKMQLSAQQALANQQLSAQLQLKAQDLQNEIALLEPQFEKEKKMAQITGDISLANMIAGKLQDKKNELALLGPKLAADQALAETQLGINQTVKKSHAERVADWATPGGR